MIEENGRSYPISEEAMRMVFLWSGNDITGYPRPIVLLGVQADGWIEARPERIYELDRDRYDSVRLHVRETNGLVAYEVRWFGIPAIRRAHRVLSPTELAAWDDDGFPREEIGLVWEHDHSVPFTEAELAMVDAWPDEPPETWPR